MISRKIFFDSRTFSISIHREKINANFQISYYSCLLRKCCLLLLRRAEMDEFVYTTNDSANLIINKK